MHLSGSMLRLVGVFKIDKQMTSCKNGQGNKADAWANYEAIQSDIFDHLLAAISEFALRLFQNPTGSDFKTIAATGVT